MDSLTIIHTIILGIVEGLTEFIPVSSTGHLIIMRDILNFDAPPNGVFEIVIQLGAILAVCWLYRDTFISTAKKAPHDKEARHFIFVIFLALLPAVFLGMLLHEFIKAVLFSPRIIAINLVIGGILMLIVERFHHRFTVHNVKVLSYPKALAIGFFQTLAMAPGVSRSGATIMGGMVLGLDRKIATEFSFFLAVPTMIGATSYDLYQNYDLLTKEIAIIMLVGFITAFLSSLVVIKWLINYVSKHNFVPFAYYRIIVGILMAVYFWGDTIPL